MLEYDSVDASEGIDVNKANASKECDIFYYWYFLDKGFRYICNGYHDLMQKTMNFSDISIVSVKGSDYRIHFSYISKDDATVIMKISDLNEKDGLL